MEHRDDLTAIWPLYGISIMAQGIETEMGAATLALGFDGLGAEDAYIRAWADNPALLRVMEKLGYVPNGEYIQGLRGGGPPRPPDAAAAGGVGGAGA